MATKIVAAKLATSAGVMTVITRSSCPGNITQIVRHVQNTSRNSQQAEYSPSESTGSPPAEDGTKVPLHTRFLPSPQPIRDRYFWLLHGLAPHGTLYIDAGAHRALAHKAGLLPVGVLDVEGSFASHEAVRIVVVERNSEPGPDGKLWHGTPQEVGRALVNYAASEIQRIKGRRSKEIQSILDYADSDYVADRDNVSLFQLESRPVTPT